MSDNDETLEGTILEPFERVMLERHTRFEEFCEVSRIALTEILGMPRLTKALRQSEKQIELAEKIAGVAQREKDGDFSTLYEYAALFTWGALESAVRDVCVNWLIHIPESRTNEEVSSIKIPLGDYEALTSNDRMRFVVSTLEQSTSAALRPGIGRFEAILKPIGLGGGVDDDVRRTLLELSAVRNLLVHRLGVADERFIQLCPWYGVELNQNVRVTQADYHGKYRKAAFSYSANVSERIQEALDQREA